MNNTDIMSLVCNMLHLVLLTDLKLSILGRLCEKYYRLNFKPTIPKNG